MRYSCREDDPGFPNYLAAQKMLRVFVDGIERARIVTADEEKRFVLMNVVDEAGMLKLNADRTEVLTETIYGDVRVERCATPAQT